MAQRFLNKPSRPSKLPRSHPRSTNNGAKKRRGASPSKPLHAIPGWLWLLAGVGVGMLVTSLVKLADVPDPEVRKPAATVQSPSGQSRPAQKPAGSTQSKPADTPRSETRFDFYTLLPEREVIVPDEREIKPPPAPTPSPQPGSPTTETPAAVPAERYLLQAGSFRGQAEADRRRAQILLLGLDARIEPVRANGDTWYRVHAGPFVNRDKLTQARELLSAEGIETLLFRQKPTG